MLPIAYEAGMASQPRPETCIISIKEVDGNSLACFRQVNDSDVLTLLELGDYKEIVKKAGFRCPSAPCAW